MTETDQTDSPVSESPQSPQPSRAGRGKQPTHLPIKALKLKHKQLFAICMLAWMPAPLIFAQINPDDFHSLHFLLGITSSVLPGLILGLVFRLSQNPSRGLTYGLSYSLLACAPGTAILFGVLWLITQGVPAVGLPLFVAAEDLPLLLAGAVLFIAGLLLPIGAFLVYNSAWILLAPVLGSALWFYAEDRLKEPPAAGPGQDFPAPTP